MNSTTVKGSAVVPLQGLSFWKSSPPMGPPKNLTRAITKIKNVGVIDGGAEMLEMEGTAEIPHRKGHQTTLIGYEFSTLTKGGL